MKAVSLVVPRYKETERDVFPLLASVSNQVGIDLADVEVVVASDGGGPGPLAQELLDLFPALDVRQVALTENGGPGMARQAGIDAARGEWLMFADADDVLHNVGAMGALLACGTENAADLVTSQWLEECQSPEGRMVYITHEHDMTWMHGKLIRRAWLAKQNVRHHPALRVHEDSYLLSIVGASHPRTARLDAVTYVWRWRPESITRRNGGSYTYDSAATFAFACTESYRECEARDPQGMPYRVTQLAIYHYFTLHRADWDAHPAERVAAERALARGMAPYWHYMDDAEPAFVADVYAGERAKHFAGQVETETLGDWLARIREGAD